MALTGKSFRARPQQNLCIHRLVIALAAAACCFAGHLPSAVSMPLLGRVSVRESLANSPVPQLVGKWISTISKGHTFTLTVNENKTCKMVSQSHVVRKGTVKITPVFVILVFDNGTTARFFSSENNSPNMLRATFTYPDKSTKNLVLVRQRSKGAVQE